MRWTCTIAISIGLAAAAGGCAEHHPKTPEGAAERSDSNEPSSSRPEPKKPKKQPKSTRQPKPDRAQPAPNPPPAPPEEKSGPKGEVERSAPRPPLRPDDSWVVFREAFDDAKDVTCEASWQAKNHFRIRTENIKRMTIDLTRLPPESPRRGPWIFEVDGQGVELYGSSSDGTYGGMRRDLVRSQNGQWTIDKSRLNRVGS